MLKPAGFACAWLFLLAVALLPGRTSATEHHRFAADPDWVELLRVVDDPDATPVADGARFLLVDDQVSLLGPAPVWHRRLVEEVVHERALAAAATLSIDFQPLYQRVELHALDIQRAGERLDRRQDADLQVLRREADMDSGILDGRLTVQITVPDVRVGDRIEYRYSVIGANPIFGDDYHDVYAAGYSVALAERRVRFLHRPGVVLHHRVDRPGYRVARDSGSGWRSVEFRASGLPRVAEDDDTPPWHDEFGRLWFSTLPDWPAVARWADPLYPSRFSDRVLAADLAARIGLDHADPRGSLQRAIAFVQGEVRYTAIDMGSNSHAPNRPETTLDRRFGDCKDKSTLLVALLAEAGIEAEPVLVNTVARATVRDRLPSPLAFDHVIVRARMGDGDVWVDPTRDRERAPLGEREPITFRYGLPVHGGGGLVEIPVAPAERPDVEVTQRIRLDTVGSKASALFGIVTDYRRGDAEHRRAEYEDEAPGDIGDRYLSYMRGFYDGIAPAGVPATAEPAEAGALRTVERYRLAWDAGEAGAFGMVLFQLGDWLPVLKRDTRTTPLLLGGPRYATQTIRADFTHGWSILPEREVIDNPWFSFERRVDLNHGDLVVTGTWRRHADDVAAADYPRFRADVGAARDLLAFDVDLKAGRPFFSAGPSAWAWPLVAFALISALLVVAWRRRQADPLSGALFAPTTTAVRVLARPLGWWPETGLVAVAALLGIVVEQSPLQIDVRSVSGLALLAGSIVAALAWFPFFALLVKGAFRLLSVSAGFGHLLRATAWACVPYILFVLAACVALGGRLGTLADDHQVQPSDFPGLLSALLLASVGIWWYIVASVNVAAVAAGTSRRRALAALALAFIFLAGSAAALTALS